MTDCTQLTEGSNLAQAMLCCTFAAADIAVAIAAAMRLAAMRLASDNVLIIGEAVQACRVCCGRRAKDGR